MKKYFLFLVPVIQLLTAGSSFAVDIPPTVTLIGGTDTNDYTLTANGGADGYGVFSGNFTAQSHSLMIVSSANGTLTFDGTISGTAVSPLPTLNIFAANNEVILNGANTFSGDVILENGTLKLGNALALGSAAGVFRNNASATLDLNGQAIAAEQAETSGTTVFRNSSAVAASWGGAIAIGTGTLTFNASAGDITVGGAISSIGGAAKAGANVLTVSGNNTGLAGVWNLEAGTLKLGHANAVGGGIGVTGSGTTIDLNGQTLAAKPIQILNSNTTIANSAAGAATWAGTILTSSGNDLAVATTSGNITLSGAITGAGNLSKSGSGTLILTSLSSTYTGNTTVGGGSVAFLGSSEFVIGASGINNSVGGSGAATFDGQFVFNLTAAGTTLGNTWNIVNVASLTETWGGSFGILGFSNAGGGVWTRDNLGTSYEFRQSTGQLSVVPEPSTVLLLAVPALAAALLRVRRRASR